MQNPLDAEHTGVRSQANHLSDVTSTPIGQRAFRILLLTGRFAVLDQEQPHPSTSPLVNASSWRGALTGARHRQATRPTNATRPLRRHSRGRTGADTGRLKVQAGHSGSAIPCGASGRAERAARAGADDEALEGPLISAGRGHEIGAIAVGHRPILAGPLEDVVAAGDAVGAAVDE
jgi:hypothetical protein